MKYSKPSANIDWMLITFLAKPAKKPVAKSSAKSSVKKSAAKSTAKRAAPETTEDWSIHMEEVENENERLRNKINGLKQEYEKIGLQVFHAFKESFFQVRIL